MKNTVSLKDFFLDSIKPYKGYLVILIFCTVCIGINNTLSPYALKLIINKTADYKGDGTFFSAIKKYACLYISLWIAISINMRLLDWVKLKLLPKLRHDLLNTMFSHLGKHSHQYFQNNFTGSLTNKISDIVSGTMLIFSILEGVFAQVISLSIAVVSMIFISPIFALFLLIWAAVFISIAISFLKPIKKLSSFFAISKTSLMGKLADVISNMATMRLFSQFNYEHKLIQDAVETSIYKQQALQRVVLRMRILWDLSIIVLVTVNIYILIAMYAAKQVTLGDFSFIIALSIATFYNLWYLASQIAMFAEEFGKCKQSLSSILEPHEIRDKHSAMPLIIKHGHIEFKKVSFGYTKGEFLFQNQSVTIESGQKVGLVGVSGSGKSTFVHLILRLFDVQKGQILIDGQDINNVTQNSLRKHIAIIPQDINLFHRSIIDNIRYGQMEANDEEVIEASKKAHCHEFIMQLSNGYNSLVGERGVKLSGGQRQRIAIARAILKNSPILILDEATSALDSNTEKLVQESLNKIIQNRTTIVIAHRLSTLLNMDRIFIFDNGIIVEDGTHKELIKKSRYYNHIWEMQARGFLPEAV